MIAKRMTAAAPLASPTCNHMRVCPPDSGTLSRTVRARVTGARLLEFDARRGAQQEQSAAGGEVLPSLSFLSPSGYFAPTPAVIAPSSPFLRGGLSPRSARPDRCPSSSRAAHAPPPPQSAVRAEEIQFLPRGLSPPLASPPLASPPLASSPLVLSPCPLPLSPPLDKPWGGVDRKRRLDAAPAPRMAATASAKTTNVRRIGCGAMT
jgi:hypothetical protein